MREKKYDYVIYQKEGNCARITLNRPEKLNVFNMMGTKEGVFTDMLDALTEAEEDDDIKVVVIKGAGKCLTAGEDLRQAGTVYGMKPGERRPSERIRLRYDRKFFDDWTRLIWYPKVLICQGHGYCLGAGSMLLLFSDIAIVAEDATLGFVEERIGVVGINPFTIPLTLAVGLKKAKEFMLTGKSLNGKEAAEIGLVNKAVPADKIDEEVEKLVQAISLLPRDGIAMGKAHFHLMYSLLGMTTATIGTYITHSLFTNIRWEPDEYSFLKERRDKGIKEALHGMHRPFEGKVEKAAEKI